MIHSLFLAAVGLAAFSGVPGWFGGSRSMGGQRISLLLFAAASAAGLASAFLCLAQGAVEQWTLPLPVCGGRASFLIDPLAAVFLAGIFLLSGVGSFFGLGYWRQTDHPGNGRKLRLFYGTLAAGMALVVSAHDSLFFLFSWEVMALSAFFLVTTEDESKEVRQAGWVYIIATHFSTLLLFAFFALLRHAAGTFELAPFRSGLPAAPEANLLFLLALIGFGIKAGLFPLHVWLPAAHANAPSHVSAVLSGVMLKVGVYGLMRACWLFADPPAWWGTLLVVLGMVSCVLGVAFALGQHDLKRLLAYHSVENIGIIFLGLGLALLGRSVGRPELVLLGLAGALLHVWNHGLFKSLLFLASGSVLHSVHTREMDRMGGLAKGMPRTAALFLVGAAAICALPPLNGFVSELFLYLGFFRALNLPSLSANAALWLAVPALALTGGLALACFTKVYGVVFLGEPRTAPASRAVEGGKALLAPMALLALACFWIGLFPQTVAPFLEAAARTWGASSPALSLSALAPLGALSGMGVFLVLVFLAGKPFLERRFLRRKEPTWDCGYVRPSPFMQYSASSYARILVDFFKWALVPAKSRVRLEGPFPEASSFHSHVPETFLDRGLLPLVRSILWVLQWFRYLQLGYLQAYVAYIFLALAFFILWR